MRTWAGEREAGGTPLRGAEKLTRFFFFVGIRNDTVESGTTAYILRGESFSCFLLVLLGLDGKRLCPEKKKQ